MKNTVRLILTTSILSASILLSNTSAAEKVSSAGQAIGLCKAQAEKAHPNYQSSKSMRIRQSRGVFKIKMRVITTKDALTIFCDVTKSGEITYMKS